MADRIRHALSLLNTYEAELAESFPSAHAEAESLAETVLDPRRSTAQEIWPRLWEKPLYANARVEVADKWRNQLEPFMSTAWHNWGQAGGVFVVERIEKGVARSSFRLTGALAEQIERQTKVARHRLYRIQGAARAFHKRCLASETPFSDCYSMPLDQCISELRKEFGDGWGAITIMHFLTDLGLSVKPDLHLVRTCSVLGLLSAGKTIKIPNLETALSINVDLVELTKLKFDAFSPDKLRYLDKLLMEISRSGLLNRDEESVRHIQGHSLAELFEVEPLRWGLQGDQFLWREIAGNFSRQALPASFSDAMKRFEKVFRTITGQDFLTFHDFDMAQSTHGRMSAGGISADFWRGSAIASLLKQHSLIAQKAALSPAKPRSG